MNSAVDLLPDTISCEKSPALGVRVPVARSIEPDRNILLQHIDTMCASRRFSNFGPIHEALRARLCEWLDADRLGLFSSATSALTVALRAHRVSGEVITTPFSFAASAQVIEWAGAVPVFVDIDPVSLTIDPARVEAAITPKTSAILAVHTYGVPCDVKALEDIAARHQLALIFDAAHAFDARIDSTPIHRFGNATIYSTHASKLFHTGEGGVLVCSDEAMQRRCDRMANFGFDGSGDALECGTNAKMSELHAATGLAVLPKVNAERAARSALRYEYTSALHGIDGISLIAPPIHVKDSLQYLAIRVKSEAPETDNRIRNIICERLLLLGLESRKYFSPLCTDFSYSPKVTVRISGELPVAKRAVHQVLCLPFHSGVDRDTVSVIADTVREVMQQRL